MDFSIFLVEFESLRSGYCIKQQIGRVPFDGKLTSRHKLLTYIECLASSEFLAPNPSPPSECVLPPHQRRGYTLAGRWGGGESIFRKTPDTGLASYSIIPLRQPQSAMGRVVNLHHAVFEKAQKYIRKFWNGFDCTKILNKFIYKFYRPSKKHPASDPLPIIVNKKLGRSSN